MAQGMKSTYGAGNVCRDFTDGTSVCMSKKAWTVFFATLNKHGWTDTSPTPKTFSATVAKEAIAETVSEIVEWYETKKGKRKPKKVPTIKMDCPKGHKYPPVDLWAETGGEPRWVALAKKIVASKKVNAGMKAYWQKRLDAYKGDCPKVKKK